MESPNEIVPYWTPEGSRCTRLSNTECLEQGRMDKNYWNNKWQIWCVFTVNQVKQKEQDLKKDYRSVKDLIDESGFGWDSDRNMVDAPDSVWASFCARKNSKEALQWRDRWFPYYEELAPLYEGNYNKFLFSFYTCAACISMILMNIPW